METKPAIAVERLPATSMSEIDAIGKMLAQSEMFGARNPAEGFVIASMCQQEGVSYRQWMETYHFIKGRVSKRADAIAADFIRSGGALKIIQRDADGAKVELSRGGNSYTSAVTWRDCLLEPFVYAGREADVVAALASGHTKDLKIKDKYATPRSRMQMFWARAISDGIRALAPDCCQGVYTPEEVDDLVPDTHAAALLPVGVIPPGKAKATLVAESIDAANQAEDAADRAHEALCAARASRPAVPPPDAEAVEVLPPDKAIDKPKKPAKAAKTEPATPFDEIAWDMRCIRASICEGGPVDYSVCPVPGGMKGKRWDGMAIAHLRLALTLENPEMKLGHRREINRLIAEREQKEAKNG